MFNRDRNFKVGMALRKTVRFLTLRWTIVSSIVNDFQHSKVLMSILLRHNHRKFSDGSRNRYMQATAGPKSAFDAPSFPAHSSHLCCHERAGWAPKLSLPQGAGKLGTSFDKSILDGHERYLTKKRCDWFL